MIVPSISCSYNELVGVATSCYGDYVSRFGPPWKDLSDDWPDILCKLQTQTNVIK
jgi:hypothetical protein